MRCTSLATTCVAVVALSIPVALAAESMRTCGIYMTAADYAERRLSFEGECHSASQKLELHDVLRTPYLDITHGGQKQRYAKSAVYGARTCSGREYRFVEDREYQILEPGPITLYTFRPAGRRAQRRYFFSVGPSGTARPLTRDNLKRAFPDNPVFHDALDRTFTSDSTLTRFDKTDKMFVLNRLLIASTSTER